MPRRAFRLAYDGRPYHGFQRQPDVTTVEGELLDALGRLGAVESETPPGYAAAGRTDAGVSARAQTVAFDAPGWLTPSALNGELPDPIRAWAHADAPAGFHATHDANWREYRYFWYAPAGGGVDDERAARALDRLLGERDFHNLTPDDANTVRELSGRIEREGVPVRGANERSSGERRGPDGDFLAVTVRASGFCRELVRRVVSLLRDVAAGEDFDRIDRVLGDDPIEGPAGVPPAPAGPLVLHDVDYDLAFEPEARAVAAVREAFRGLRAERRALARVAAHVADSV